MSTEQHREYNQQNFLVMPTERAQLLEVERFLAKPSNDPLSEAFDKKFTVHAGPGVKGVKAEDIAPRFEELMSNPVKTPTAIYLHFPFCQTKCLYCGFHGRHPEKELSATYIKAMLEEISWLKDQPAARGPVRAIYLGGGTPSVMPPEGLALIIENLSKYFDLANDCEITLEGRLHDFTPTNAENFLEAGFNRFSIGVQSFNTDIRRSLGRISDRETVIQLLSNLTSHQKAAVIIDLIYGLPGQSPSDFVDDLKTANTLDLDGLDTYQLNIFKGTPLDKAMISGKLPQAASLKEQGKYYQKASKYLLEQRWRQLSLSHFAKTFRERNIYNPWAKRRANCLALGAGAGGFLDGWSFYRKPNLEDYLQNSNQKKFTPDHLTPPAPNRLISTYVVEQMEQGYLNYQKLFDEFLTDPAPLAFLLANWQEQGLVILDKGWLTMTVAGRFWGVNLAQAIIETALMKIKENWA